MELYVKNQPAMNNQESLRVGGEPNKSVENSDITRDVDSRPVNDKAVDNTSKIISQINDISLDITIESSSNQAVINLRSKTTGEVLFTIPAEESRNIQRTIQAIKGTIFNQSI